MHIRGLATGPRQTPVSRVTTRLQSHLSRKKCGRTQGVVPRSPSDTLIAQFVKSHPNPTRMKAS